jgi:hypothetical protein
MLTSGIGQKIMPQRKEMLKITNSRVIPTHAADGERSFALTPEEKGNERPEKRHHLASPASKATNPHPANSAKKTFTGSAFL